VFSSIIQKTGGGLFLGHSIKIKIVRHNIYPLFGIQKRVEQGCESVLKGHWKGVGRTLEGPCDDLGPSNPLPMPL